MGKWFKPTPGIHEDEDYRLAYQHLLKFEPKSDIDYGWAISYAEKHFERIWSVHEALEDKAESVIRIFASGGALLALGAIANTDKFLIASGLLWSLGLLSALAAVLTAGLVRYPKTTFMPPSAAWTAQIAEERGKQSQAAFIAQWHLASEGLRLGSIRKAKALKRSMVLGLIALGCLALSFPAGLIESRIRLRALDSIVEKPDMPTDQPTASPPPAPNPASQPQTPVAGAKPGPQMIDRGSQPTAPAPPSVVEFTGQRSTANTSD